MTPNTTQSVCTCKVVSPRQVEDGECLICGKPFEPVAEPASTGEPPPTERTITLTALWHLLFPEGTHSADFINNDVGEWLDAYTEEVERYTKRVAAARPSGPSAPQLRVKDFDWQCDNCGFRDDPTIPGKPTICPKCGWNKWTAVSATTNPPSAPQKSAIEIAGERDLKIITEPIDWEAVENDAAPQTSAEQKKPFSCPIEIQCDHAERCLDRCQEGFVGFSMSPAAPQPVSGAAPSPTPSVSTEPTSAPATSPAWQFKEELNAKLDNALKSLAAPSVAGTQPGTVEVYNNLATGVYLATAPQVEECPHCGICRAKKKLRASMEHGVGAPAQPGPDIKKEKTMLYEISEDKLYPGSFRVEAIDQNGDGDCFVAVFDGPDAQQRATEYATWKNQPNAAPAEGTPEPPKVEAIARKIPSAQELAQAAFSDEGWDEFTMTRKRLMIEGAEATVQELKRLGFLGPYFPPASQNSENIANDLCVIGRRVLDCLDKNDCSDGVVDEIEACMHNLNIIVQKLRKCDELATPASTVRTEGWVSVEERLPKDTIAKMVYVTESLCHYTASWDGGDWLSFHPGNHNVIDGVTHWKEIQNDIPAAPGSVPQAPESPKEEKQ